MRLADSKITLTIEMDHHEHYKVAAALKDVCIHAKTSSDPVFRLNVEQGVEPILYFLNLSIPTRATAWGWPEEPTEAGH